MNIRFDARAFLAALVLWVGAVGAARAQNLITDPGFANVNNTFNPTSFTDWTLSNASVSTQDHGTYTGNYSARLRSPSGSVSQSLATLSAGSYTLSFWIDNTNNGSNQSSTWSVSIGTAGTVFTGSIAKSSGWVLETTIINLATSVSTPTFAINDTGNYSFHVDDVTLSRVPGPVPGAGLLSYFALGLAGFGLQGRKLLAKARSLFAGEGA